MARFVRSLPLCLLFVATTLISPESSAQTQPAKAPTQGAKKQAQSGATKAQPGKTQAAPTPAPAKATGGQTNATDAKDQSGAKPDQSGGEQPKPASTPTQPPNTQAPEITGVSVFQTAATQDDNGSFYLEISGKSLPTTSPTVFLAPQKGITGTPDVVSAKDSQIVVKFTASKGYFPSTIGVGGTGGTAYKDVDQNANVNSTLPRIDDVEVLQLNRLIGTGSIKIDGANFGTDKSKVSVTIVPRNPVLQVFALVTPPDQYTCPPVKPVQAAAIEPRSVQTGIVLVDFSFPCVAGYSTPFVIARVLVTVTDKDGGTFTASYETLPGRDKNLTYRYTIMNSDQAKSRFGEGIAENFYVVQLSIVNKGSVKVQVPLASIQAEVEWYAGSVGKLYYKEGPPTVAPVPLAGAVSYFSIYRQARGNRAKAFNILQGLTTIGSAIQLFFGPGFAQGVAIAGGGFRQGFAQIWQDLSDQQLANLTSQSFESIETVSGNGGTVDKVVFIQRGEVILPSSKLLPGFRTLVSNVLGFEITGYQVPETAAETGTPQ